MTARMVNLAIRRVVAGEINAVLVWTVRYIHVVQALNGRERAWLGAQRRSDRVLARGWAWSRRLVKATTARFADA